MRDPLHELVQLLLDRVGLHIDGPMRGRLESIVDRWALERSCQLSDVLADLLRSPQRLTDLVDELTVKETSFLREPGQLQAFIHHVLPVLPDPVTVWSAACATGQEAYSLAMLLHEAGRRDATVLATDVSPSAVAHTRRGWYSSRELRGLDPERQARWMTAERDGWQVRPEIQAMVRTHVHNLVSDPLPVPPGQVSVLFLRNVLIYFPAAVCASLLTRLGGVLRPDGWMFLGAGETLLHSPAALRIHQLPGAFAYRPVTAHVVQEAPKRRPVPVSRPRQPRTDGATLMRRGSDATLAGDYATAVESYRKAAYLDPLDVEAQVHLAFSLEASGDLAAAARAFRATLQLVRSKGGCLPPQVLAGYTEASFLRLLQDRAALTPTQEADLG